MRSWDPAFLEVYISRGSIFICRSQQRVVNWWKTNHTSNVWFYKPQLKSNAVGELTSCNSMKFLILHKIYFEHVWSWSSVGELRSDKLIVISPCLWALLWFQKCNWMNLIKYWKWNIWILMYMYYVLCFFNTTWFILQCRFLLQYSL